MSQQKQQQQLQNTANLLHWSRYSSSSAELPLEDVPLEGSSRGETDPAEAPEWVPASPLGGPPGAPEAPSGAGELAQDRQDLLPVKRRGGPWAALKVLQELLSVAAFHRQLLLTVFCFSFPLLLFAGWSCADSRARCLYAVAVMVLCWLSNCLDPYAVALLPFVLFPGLRVASVGLVASFYMNSVSFLIFGSSMMAAALRRVKLDLAAARWLARISPQHPEDLALCLMLTCFSISTCLSNTGTMLIFCPIIDLLIRGIHPHTYGGESSPADRGGPPPPPPQQQQQQQRRQQQQQQESVESDLSRCASGSRSKVSPLDNCLCVISVAPSTAVTGSSPAAAASPPPQQQEASGPLDQQLEEEILHEPPKLRRIRNLLFIGCAYAATLGGSATVTGSTSNAIFLAVLDAMYATLPAAAGAEGPQVNPVTYTTWLVVSLPLALVQLFMVWASLCALWTGPRATKAALARLAFCCCMPLKAALCCCCCCKWVRPRRASRELSAAAAAPGGPGSQGAPRGPRAPTGNACAADHGELYWGRVYVVVAWLLLVCLWLSRKTIVPAVPGWGTPWEGFIDDSFAAVVVPLGLWFAPLYPRRPKPSIARAISAPVRWAKRQRRVRFPENDANEAPAAAAAAAPRTVAATRKQPEFEGILTFSVVEKEMDWGLLFLLGSGFVVASVSHVCGLDMVLIDYMEFLKQQTKETQVACIMAMAALVTQVTSNTATASIIMPLLSTAAKGLQGNPLLLLLAANFATTLGFLLPVSTASNAVIVRFTRIGVWQFFLSGLLPLVLCLGAAYVASLTWVAAVFRLNSPYPSSPQ
ncbi:solute carrier family 13, putative [Eimeria tenella]|uniref:Solute carrier family 13, putative n=1 Tax=Eimeria tenella TaxID=5802 RepID=U6KQ43_EIMTE|nr:solute carrier family 13, putative [Eimeria tenella]CDJ38382.1 solute carrier family 13, putative [Eimeria tenella]|eukprot:XP_013229220.1 solute carrier family 13, putative [Eimeria tenella]